MACSKFAENKLIKRCLDVATAQAFPSCPNISGVNNIDSYFPKYNNFYDFICACYKHFILYGDCLIYSYRKNNNTCFACLAPESYFISKDSFFYFDKFGSCRKLSSRNIFFITNEDNDKKSRGSGAFEQALKYERALNRIDEISLNKSVEASKLFLKSRNDHYSEEPAVIGEEGKSNNITVKRQLAEDMKIIEVGNNQEIELHEISVEQQKYRNDQIIKKICLIIGVDYFLVTGDSSNIVERSYKTYHESNNQIITQSLHLYFKPLLRFIGLKLGVDNPVIEFAELLKQNKFMHLRCKKLEKELEQKEL